MKCELCGYEWVQFIQNVSQKKYKHMLPNTCALRHLPIMWEADVMSINAAIIEARKDNRKPEDCKNWAECDANVVIERDGGGDVKQECCPCAAWEKK